MRIAYCMVAACLLAGVACAAQDLVAVAPKNAKVEYEDARIRVVRLHIAPDETLPMHDRPARVVIALTANDVRLTMPGGRERAVNVPAGSIAWSGPGRRSVSNLDAPLDNVIVEMKDARAPAEPVLHPPSPENPRILTDRYHHWLFENQYVRVYDVHIPPGKMTEFHRHAYDTVVVQVSGGRTSSQLQGEEWSAPEQNRAGMVAFHPDASKPYTHRVHNLGKTEFHVVLVQLLQ